MDGKYRTMNTGYKCIASVPSKPDKIYLGLSEDEWKSVTITIENRSETNVINRKQHYSVRCRKQNVPST